MIVALIAMVVISAVSILGSNLSGRFSAAAAALDGSTGSDDGGGGAIAAKILAAGDWLVQMGQGTMAGALLTLNPNGSTWQSRVFANAPWSSSDMTISTTARQTGAGNGYGLWLRTTRDSAGNMVSGYTFQVDPGSGGYTLKLWNNGAEQQLARVPVSGHGRDSGSQPHGEHGR